MISTRSHRLPLALLLVLLSVPAASAQTTTGTIAGRITDEQGAAIPGVTVQATDAQTGFVRTDVSDATGSYRLAALPVGTYDVVAALEGFRSFERTLVVNVATNLSLDVTLRIGGLQDTVTVSGTADAVERRSSSVSDVVDLARIQGLPLNGRQFANLASTVPGVGLGYHSDVSKTAQYTPQISGGNGRNINYVVDGGDNNDDTVGGLLQLFPLEAIQEFKVATQRFDAEHGRSNGAVLNVVTKSGTNTLHGSWFTLMRDDALNARTFSETINDIDKQDYRRYQYGGSFGGPIVRDRAHYFAAYERTNQDTSQVVNTFGLFPQDDGVFPIELRQNLLTTKLTVAPAPSHYLAVRYGRDHNTQPSGAGMRNARSTWSTSTNSFDSANVNHNWVIRGSGLNELVVQYSRFRNDTPAAPGPTLRFPNGVVGGSSLIGAQSTEQVKWQLRDDYSWTTGGLGLSHEVRTGINWLHEPRLYTSTEQGKNGVFGMALNDINGPVSSVLVIGGNTSSNIGIDLVGGYIQDDWRATDRLTLNLGVRWDYVSGMPLDQSRSANFLAMQAAGATGRFDGTTLEAFGREPRGDWNNVQPRVGAAYDVRGDGRDIVRAGWGIYTDFGYTNSNALTAAIDAGGGGGIVFSAVSENGLRKPDGSFFTVNDSWETIQSLNQVDPSAPLTAGEVVSPRLEQPFTYQTNAGWSHLLDASTELRFDYVRVQGRDLNIRLRPNVLVNGVRALAGVGIQPNNQNFRVAVSEGRSEYNALITSVRRRMRNGLDVSASYTLGKATSDTGTAYDEIAGNNIQNIGDPFGDVQQAPSSRTDSRHQISVSAIVQGPWRINVAPIFMYRSALPVFTYEGLDLNRDGNVNDITPIAYRYTGLDDNGMATYEEAGPCETVNCSRRAGFSQLNLRVSRSFRLIGQTRIEAIGEIFNLFNAKNPSFLLSQRRMAQPGVANNAFMQPNAFAGDVGQPEQRVGQVGFRFTF